MAKDVTGVKFHKLTAIEKVGRKGSNCLWKCLCDCGKETITTTTSLLLGNTKSCGCILKDVKKASREDFVGKTFFHLTVLEDLGSKNKKRYVLARCVCGVEKPVMASSMKYGKIISCGCIGFKKRIAATTKHRLSGNRLYFIWAGMMNRCYNESFQDYHNYGGRGIKVCEKWHDVRKFIEDMEEGSDKKLQLDRIDNNGNYSKENCRWVTRKENNRNKRTNVFITIGGETKTATEWAEIYGVDARKLMSRFRKGEKNEQILLFGKEKQSE